MTSRLHVEACRATLGEEPGDVGGFACHIVQATHIPPNDPDGPTVDGVPFSTYKLYVCNHNIVTSNLVSIANPNGLLVFQCTPSLIYNFGAGDEVYGGIQSAVISGAHSEASTYFHSSLPATSGNRVLHPSGTSYYVRPSAALGATIGGVIVAQTDAAFRGVLLDECQANIPNSYWNAWVAAADGPLSSERAAYETLWDLNIANCMAAVKGAWLTTRALLANTAGGTYALCDGIMIEGGHITTNGEAWALQKFTDQCNLWLASSLRFPWAMCPNTAYNYPMSVSGLVYECKVLP